MLGVELGSGVSGGVPRREGHLHDEMTIEKDAPAATLRTTTGCRVLTTLPTLRLEVSPCPSCPARPANHVRLRSSDSRSLGSTVNLQQKVQLSESQKATTTEFWYRNRPESLL